jgi:hypothetical protein
MQGIDYSFEVLHEEDRRVASTVNLVSRLIKLAILVACIVVLCLGIKACGPQAHAVFVTLTVLMSADLILLAGAQIAISVQPGRLANSYLCFYAVVKWLLRGGVVVCSVVITEEYFTSTYTCTGGIKTLLFAFTLGLDLLAFVYILLLCCMTCACICEESGPVVVKSSEMTYHSYRPNAELA